MILSSIIVNAQIDLEAIYPNASLSGATNIHFGIVNLGNLTYKYYFVNLDNSEITLYNLDHSIYLPSIQIPETWNAYNYNILYIANTLFDCDSTNIEYLLSNRDSVYVKIYREDGNMLFCFDSAQAYSAIGPPLTHRYPIINTPAGAKMLLDYSDGSVRVYSLCGSLPNKIPNSIENNFGLSNSYPNPAKNYTRIDYQLPTGINKGEIVFYDAKGNEVKRFVVDRTFNHLRISTAELSSGTYFYNLQTSKGIVGAKKLVVIK